MTEEEAKTKWCPFPRNEKDFAVHGTRCLASQCMAWRWDMVRNPDYTTYAAVGLTPDPTPQYIHSKEHGHCGLAHG